MRVHAHVGLFERQVPVLQRRVAGNNGIDQGMAGSERDRNQIRQRVNDEGEKDDQHQVSADDACLVFAGFNHAALLSVF